METGPSQEQEEEDVAVPPVAVAVCAPPVAAVPWSPPWCRLNRDEGEASRGRCNGGEWSSHRRWREGEPEEDETCEKGDAQGRNRSSANTIAGIPSRRRRSWYIS
ncbi:uncharacterized protein DS421_11g334650 [Arachis hypogaea]|nr:uncharacterized protein DS421_11g334650 [Arachis hypogaea]